MRFFVAKIAKDERRNKREIAFGLTMPCRILFSRSKVTQKNATFCNTLKFNRGKTQARKSAFVRALSKKAMVNRRD